VKFVRYSRYTGDDFGLSVDVNRGFAIAHEQGILSSASLMTKGLAVTRAVDYAKSHPELSIGLHIDLGCWAHREGKWQQLYHVAFNNPRTTGGRNGAPRPENSVRSCRRRMMRRPMTALIAPDGYLALAGNWIGSGLV